MNLPVDPASTLKSTRHISSDGHLGYNGFGSFSNSGFQVSILGIPVSSEKF
jgi:hypothetical protein